MKFNMSKDKSEFINLLFSSCEGNNVISFDNEIIVKLINRLNRDKTTVLPYITPNKLFWLILNKDKIDLIKHKSEITEIIVDDYGEINNYHLKKFDVNKKIGEKGARLFPNGYASFTSPNKSNLIKKILSAIDIWIELDNNRPEIKKDYSKSNVYYLRSNFHQAIALKNWDEAERSYNELKEKHFLTDYNINFLKIKLLSAQDKWKEIWEDDIFNHLARFKPLPKKVRQALLTSFYNLEVKPLEEKDTELNNIYARFKENHDKLGSIINYRAGLSGEVIYRLFTYKYYFDNEVDKLKEIKNLSENKNTLNLIEIMFDRMSMTQKRKTSNNNEEEIFKKARKLIEEEKYDDAIIYALDMKRPVYKTKILMSTAVMTEDTEIIDLAREEYLKLDEKEKSSFLSNPNTKSKVKIILGYNLYEDNNSEVKPNIENWLNWFYAVSNNKSNDILTEGLENIITKDDYDNWNLHQIEKLEDIIFKLLDSEKITSKNIRILNRGISDFIGYLLKDPEYPNNYADDLYLTVLWALNKYCNKNKTNTRMLYKITEGILTVNLEKRDEVWEFIVDWFEIQPIITLQEDLLDILELFSDYGQDNSLLSNLWISWVGSLINSFSKLKQVELELWYQLGNEIKSSTKLLEHLEDLISKKNEDKEINYFNKLDGEIITIFTFREKSAKRVKNKIKSINSNVNIRICTDSKLTSRAENYAKNSDINIITTDCISHALTYGIAPYLNEDSLLYPRSSGQSAILEAIQEYLKDRN